MQSIDEVDESCAWSPSSISPLSRLHPRVAFPNRLPSLIAALRALGAPTAAQPTDPPTPTQPLKMSVNATSSRARLFDVLLNDEQCAAFADARRVCLSRAPAPAAICCSFGEHRLRLLDYFTYLEQTSRACTSSIFLPSMFACPLNSPEGWLQRGALSHSPARVEVTGRGSKGRLGGGSCESCGRCPISRFFPHAGLQDTAGSAGALRAHRGAGPCIARDAPV